MKPTALLRCFLEFLEPFLLARVSLGCSNTIVHVLAPLDLLGLRLLTLLGVPASGYVHDDLLPPQPRCLLSPRLFLLVGVVVCVQYTPDESL